jgi:hypothetical protein
MKNISLLLYLLLFFTFSGCNSDDSAEGANEILIFGWFADSSCSGDCADIYKIEDGKVYKDMSGTYPENSFFEGDFQLIAEADYPDFKPLLVELPNELLDEPNGYLDCLDCTNANGGFYLELKNDEGFHASWRYRNVMYPEYMEAYRSLLLDKLALLNSL